MASRLFTRKDIERATEELAIRIIKSPASLPDIIVGVSGGAKNSGLAEGLGKGLSQKSGEQIPLVFWKIRHEYNGYLTAKVPQCEDPPCELRRDSAVLLVDDIVHTGGILERAVDRLRGTVKSIDLCAAIICSPESENIDQPYTGFHKFWVRGNCHNLIHSIEMVVPRGQAVEFQWHLESWK